jgi:DNA-binding HxlR family transcriptional regulator
VIAGAPEGAAGSAPEAESCARSGRIAAAAIEPVQRVRTRTNITCNMQVRMIISDVPGKPKSQPRSGCPVSISLEIFGDRWSLLIVRDLMVRGFRTFKQFQQSGEKIATNILADRLRKLEAAGIITAETQPADARRVNYRLTEKGIDLAPVMLELLLWGARHEQTQAPRAFIAQAEKNREELLREVRRRWRAGDATPLIPTFRQVRKERG